MRWRLVEEPTFDNQIGTLTFEGRHASLRLERATPGDPPTLETSLEQAPGLARAGRGQSSPSSSA